ncbi:MAG: hypothetical protein RSA90_02230 [Lachnospiraceae bacterium]
MIIFIQKPTPKGDKEGMLDCWVKNNLKNSKGGSYPKKNYDIMNHIFVEKLETYPQAEDCMDKIITILRRDEDEEIRD